MTISDFRFRRDNPGRWADVEAQINGDRFAGIAERAAEIGRRHFEERLRGGYADHDDDSNGWTEVE